MVTGWDVDAPELRETTQRIMAAKKMFNIQAGWSPVEDTLPTRFFDDALPDDPARLSRGRLTEMIRCYNLTRGWRADGFLTDEAVGEFARSGGLQHVTEMTAVSSFTVEGPKSEHF